MARTAGYSDHEAQISANKTVEIEQMLAQWQTDEPFVPLADSYHHYDMPALQENSPNIPWSKYFNGKFLSSFNLHERCKTSTKAQQ